MERMWITNGSTSLPPVINPLAAACHDGYIPTSIHVLSNPTIEAVTESVTTMAKTVVTASGGDEPDVEVTTIDEETEFGAIAEYLADAIQAARSAEAEVAVDITPGRKFWSFISVQSGLHHDVDHLYYVHIDGGYFGETFPTIPRTAIELYDFTEVLDAR
ncbi:MAG: hypothetical protein ACOC42_04055 [Halobacteriota archaeon]